MGRELDVVLIMENRVQGLIKRGKNIGVEALVIPPGMRGYVFIEADNLSSIYRLMSNIKYVKTVQPMIVSSEELERLVKPKPITELVSIGDIVEIVRGPFRGMKAQVMSINKSKNTVTVSILEAAFAVPIEIPSEYVKPAREGG